MAAGQSALFAMNISAVRYWEKEFDILKPKKNKKGNRFFTIEDVEHFHIIYYLVKELGLTLKGAQKKLKEMPRSVNSVAAKARRKKILK